MCTMVYVCVYVKAFGMKKGDCPKNSHVVFCPHKQRSFEPFTLEIIQHHKTTTTKISISTCATVSHETTKEPTKLLGQLAVKLSENRQLVTLRSN